MTDSKNSIARAVTALGGQQGVAAAINPGAAAQAHRDLHGAILNLSADTVELSLSGFSEAETKAYKLGHRNARHSAAELVAVAESCAPQALQSTELAELRRLALAATPGEWSYTGPEHGDGGGVYHTVQSQECEITGEVSPSAEDAAYIAAANPATVLRLLDAIAAPQPAASPTWQDEQPPTPRDVRMEEIRSAIARAWRYPSNAHKAMDESLVNCAGLEVGTLVDRLLAATQPAAPAAPVCSVCNGEAMVLAEGAMQACGACQDITEDVAATATVPAQGEREAFSQDWTATRFKKRTVIFNADGNMICGFQFAMDADVVVRSHNAAIRAALAAKVQPCGWIQFIDGVQTQNFARDEGELATIKSIAEVMGYAEKSEYVPVYRAAQVQPVAVPDGVKLRAFIGADTKQWHISIEHPFGTSFVRMSDIRDAQLAELLAAAPAPAQQDKRPFKPTDEQFREWCERHDMEQHLDRQAFDDAASLYLTAQQDKQAGDVARDAWVSVKDRLPLDDDAKHVLVYTDGVDFAGEQHFVIKADDLWNIDMEERTEVAAAATHWQLLTIPQQPDGAGGA